MEVIKEPGFTNSANWAGHARLLTPLSRSYSFSFLHPLWNNISCGCYNSGRLHRHRGAKYFDMLVDSAFGNQYDFVTFFHRRGRGFLTGIPQVLPLGSFIFQPSSFRRVTLKVTNILSHAT